MQKAAIAFVFFAASILATAQVVVRTQLCAGEVPETETSATPNRIIEFSEHIQPILAKACYSCHGPTKQEAGLRLDAKRYAFRGADSGPVIIPYQSEKSKLIRLIKGLDSEIGLMPPDEEGAALSDDHIALMEAWIDAGASWPDSAGLDARESGNSKHWSFQPIKRPRVPAVSNAAFVQNPIDAFILSRLEDERIAPSPFAARTTLLRRVYLDLIGLPPKPVEIEEFLSDDQPNAYERLVDRLLESPHYGERWGRHWLDAARYADTDGYSQDEVRPFAWRYRDWVIDSLNADMPFDVFSVQQLAGDLLLPSEPEYDPAALVAAGFHRNTLLNKEGGVDPEEDRVKRTIDRANTLGTAWLGLSVGCANCHTHKYDPITQREYFGLYAFFDNIEEVNVRVSADGMAIVERVDLTPREEEADSPDVDALGAANAAKQSPIGENRGVADSPAQRKPKAHQLNAAMAMAQTVTEAKTQRETFVHLRGDFLSKGPSVDPGTPEVLPPLESRGDRADRLDLARWLFARGNPLTARVAVNRLWQHHFGRGLVATGDDFGTQGDLPSHPELLDWLASELRDGGWKLKHIHRLIVNSSTYRQASTARPDLVDRDPYNMWLSRQNRLRVEAEIVRDLALCVSGLMNSQIGGPSVRPPQPPGVSAITFNNKARWVESTGPDRYRRGLYIWFQRTSPYPSLIAFDAPDANLTCNRRERSNTPLQALTLLNDKVFVECAQSLGRRIARDIRHDEANSETFSEHNEKEIRPNDPPLHNCMAGIERAFHLCLARQPSSDELVKLVNLYGTIRRLANEDSKATAKLVGSTNELPSAVRNRQGLADVAACVAVARAILNLDEFITRE